VRLVIDQQLPPVLAEWLRGQGLDAWHVRELGLKDRPDHDIWINALQDDGVIVSRDSDFANFARQGAGGRLVWLRIGNCSNPDLIAVFERLWPAIAERLDAGEGLIEVRP
jgi:predicted nuclease of predicted toxin-antitoxin system